MTEIRAIYTDGACEGNPGPGAGAWSFTLPTALCRNWGTSPRDHK